MSYGFLVLIPIVIAIVVIVWMKKRPGHVHPTIKDIKKRLEAIDKSYTKIPIYEGDSAYTEDKSVIYICLRHPKTGERYSVNTLMYVCLHEIAHAISNTYGHGKEWKNNFSKLLNLAYKRGVYDPSQPIPNDYCGSNSH